MLTLRPLFETTSRSELLHAILQVCPLAPRNVRRGIPRDLETIVVKALAKEPSARYRSAEEMADDLRRFLADRPILSRRPSAAERLTRWCRREPLIASLTGIVAALLLAAVFILSVGNARIRHQSERTLAALAEKNAALETAGTAVERMLVRISDDQLSGLPRHAPLRRALLQDALSMYDGLLKQSVADPAGAMRTAALQLKLGKINQELVCYPAALQAYRQAIAVLEPLVAGAAQ